MSSDKVIPVTAPWAVKAWINKDKYKEMYARSISDPDGFWAEAAQRLQWQTFPTKIRHVSFDTPVDIRWYEDGVLNVSVNCLDRHLASKGNDTAIIWEGDNPEVHRHISYNELHAEVCRMANVLKKRGIKKR